MTLLLLFAIPAFALTGSNTALAHLGAASHFFNDERFEQAAAEYQAALDADPKLPVARRDLAICLFQLRQYNGARDQLAKLRAAPSMRSVAHYYLGRIDLIEGKLTSAIQHFRSIPRTHPFRDERYFLGMAYFKSASWEKSVEVLQQSIKENPRDSRSHQLLARAFQKLGREQAAAAEFSETRRLLTYYTEGSQALKRCGQTLSNQDAIEIEKVCGPLLDTDDVDKLSALGLLLGKAEHFEQAEVAWNRAVSLDPDSSEIRYDLALTCFYLKDRGCARSNSAAAIQTRPEFPEAQTLYASVLYTMGADVEALLALRKAYALSPHDSSVRELLINELLLWAEQNSQDGNATDARHLISELDGLRPLGLEQERRLLALRRRLAKQGN